MLGDQDTGLAVLVAPVIAAKDRDLAAVHQLVLTLVAIHIDADHLTARLDMKRATGCRIAAAASAQLACVEIRIEEGTPLRAGSVVLHPFYPPGHTESHVAYLSGDRV